MKGTVIEGGLTVPVFFTFERIAGVNALTVPEILGAILDYVTPSTLASAARVSRTWSTIALNKLWSDRDIKLIDLLQILPLKLETQKGTHWRLQQTPTDDQWTRFQSYASRVRSLSTARRGRREWLDGATTEWRVENEVLFPRLRRVRWDLNISPLPSFVTPRLRELYLNVYATGPVGQENASLAINSIAAIEDLRLEKLKLFWLGHLDTKLRLTLTNLVVAKKDSIRTLEFLNPYPGISFMVGHSFLKLKALNIRIPYVGGAEGKASMNALVEGCPHVEYLRIERTHINLLEFPGFHLIFAWHLLSFEIRLLDGVRVSQADLGEMAKAWPKLKKLNLNWGWHSSDNDLPLSSLADIGIAFPELEYLSALFSYPLDDEPLLRTTQMLSSSARYPLSRLQKLRLKGFPLPECQDQQDLMARFLAKVLPPGLRIERMPHEAPVTDPDLMTKVKEAVMTGRDIDPEWDSLFQTVEELHGGVRIWVGMLPDDSGDVWF